MKWKYFVTISLLLLTLTSHAQVLIVAIFGDKLNSGKIEFGLNGGYNPSWLIGQKEAQTLNNFNLGFFFHIKLNEKSFISTGVHVKSNVVGSGNPTYAISNKVFDDVYANR